MIPFFSVIIPSYLGQYPNCATNREYKFKRAINSVKNQTFKSFEIIVVSDGCIITERLCKELNVKCISIPKQPLFSGAVRNNGLKRASGEYVIYLDTDDYYEHYHLEHVHAHVQANRLPNYVTFADNINTAKFEFGKIGTSNICHKNNKYYTWNNCNGYGHDWTFIFRYFQNSIQIPQAGYVVCHIPNQLDK